ncbi:MAG: outer membrane lipoprotein-sorting protein [Desulfobacteraceae bacterium]|nr:MAG: outer membrane lipoprotein-sorting protein [Desulfobacteraceae bacterium]
MFSRYKYRLFVLVLGFILLCFHAPASADLTPRDILKKADQARGNLGGVEWEIEIQSIEEGRQQDRVLKVTARDFNSLAEFLEPAKVKGQKILMIDRNMWFMKPGLSKAVPISPRQKLMGGAANGDIASTNYAGDYEVSRFSEEQADGAACYLFDLKAIDKKVTYDRIKYWVSKEHLLGVKAEFYTVSGKLFKTAEFRYENSITVDGQIHAFISQMIIMDAVIKEDITTMIYRRAVVKKVSDSVFNLNLLLR